MPGLGTSFGRGAATSFQQDLENSDCILIMGSNMAEAHPVGFVSHEGAGARRHSDSCGPALHAHLGGRRRVRENAAAGTDIAFLGGIIRYILENERYFKEYVVHYTNAATLIADEYRHEEDAGLFAGFNPATGSYDLIPGAWEYMCEPSPDGARGLPRIDPTLQNPVVRPANPSSAITRATHSPPCPGSAAAVPRM